MIVTSTPDMLLSESEAAMLLASLLTLGNVGSQPNTALCQTTGIAPNLNVSSIQQSGLCRDTPEAVPEERENLPDSGARFCSSRLARPSTWVFHQVGALADWQQDHHTEKWRKTISIGFCL